MVYTVAGWALFDILNELRGITGRPDISMMSNQTAVDFINRYYQYVLPKELKIFWGYTYYQFYTIANIDQYAVPGVGQIIDPVSGAITNGTNISFETFNPQVWCDGFSVNWSLDPDTFYEDFPLQVNKINVGTGDGMTNSFSYNLSAFPALQGSVYVTDGTQIAQDLPTGTTGNGTFIDPNNNNAAVAGAINYASGSVTNQGFTNPPAANANIIATSETFIPARPVEMLFYKSQPLANSTAATREAVNMFVLRPVPDQVYLMKLQGIQIPAPLINDSDVPFRTDLGPLIALGAALHIFKLFNQMDQYDQYLPEYNRYKDICMQDTYEEYLYQRSVPTF